MPFINCLAVMANHRLCDIAMKFVYFCVFFGFLMKTCMKTYKFDLNLA